EGQLIAPQSQPVRMSYPVTVLPAMWRPLKGSDRPIMIRDVLSLNRPARINGLAVLRDGPEGAVAALRRTLETWQSMVGPGGMFAVAAVTELAHDNRFFWPAHHLAKPFNLDLSKKRQIKWDRLLADLPSLQALCIESDLGFGRHGPPADYDRRHAARV